MAVVLDDHLESAATIQSAIRGDVRITGQFSKAQIDWLVQVLRAGALPAQLKPLPVSERTLEPAKQKKPRE